MCVCVHVFKCMDALKACALNRNKNNLKAKVVIKFAQGTSNFTLSFSRGSTVKLSEMCDALTHTQKFSALSPHLFCLSSTDECSLEVPNCIKV